MRSQDIGGHTRLWLVPPQERPQVPGPVPALGARRPCSRVRPGPRSAATGAADPPHLACQACKTSSEEGGCRTALSCALRRSFSTKCPAPGPRKGEWRAWPIHGPGRAGGLILPPQGGSWGPPAATPSRAGDPRSTYALEVVGGDGGWAPGHPEWADHRPGGGGPFSCRWGSGGFPQRTEGGLLLLGQLAGPAGRRES